MIDMWTLNTYEHLSGNCVFRGEVVKRIVSISLGSSKRDHRAESEFCGQRFEMQRIGVDGDYSAAEALIRRLDGQVDVFGLGGADLYIYAGSRRYTFRESAALARAAVKTPIVDGSGLKNTLERRIIEQLVHSGEVDFNGKNVLMVCAVDRFGMAEAIANYTESIVSGDLMFGLGLPIPLRSLRQLDLLARVIAPIVTQLPMRWFYPTGRKQQENTPQCSEWFEWADIVAGDFHYIRRFCPRAMAGKIIITNTVTTEDVAWLQQRGVSRLITTTPSLQGRSFGTNVMEAVVVALTGKRPEQLSVQDYETVLDCMELKPHVVDLS